MQFSMQPNGDTGLKMHFFGQVSPELNKKIQLFCQKLEASPIEGMVEWVPAYDSIAIYYLPFKITYGELCEEITRLTETFINEREIEPRLLHIPVYYGGEYGPDLERVARYNQCSVKEVIEMHQSSNYLVYMLGFLPGFPYLGGLNPAIATPRLEKPRKATFPGAVGIAQEQTGIYPFSSPGGWNLIGKTPLQLFQKEQEDKAFVFRTGDHVRFYQITEKELLEIEQLIVKDMFTVEISYLGSQGG